MPRTLFHTTVFEKEGTTHPLESPQDEDGILDFSQKFRLEDGSTQRESAQLRFMVP